MAFTLDKLDPKDAEKFIELALDGLNAIATLVGGTVEDKASEILDGVKAIVSTVFRGHKGDITIEQAQNELKQLKASLVANDARADAALAAKFGQSEDPK
jgi:hypothetical protein